MNAKENYRQTAARLLKIYREEGQVAASLAFAQACDELDLTVPEVIVLKEMFYTLKNSPVTIKDRLS